MFLFPTKRPSIHPTHVTNIPISPDLTGHKEIIMKNVVVTVVSSKLLTFVKITFCIHNRANYVIEICSDLSAHPYSPPQLNDSVSLRKILSDAKLIVILLTTIVGSSILGFQEPNLGLYLEKCSYGPAAIGGLFLLRDFLFAIGSMIVGYLVRSIPYSSIKNIQYLVVF